MNLLFHFESCEIDHRQWVSLADRHFLYYFISNLIKSMIDNELLWRKGIFLYYFFSNLIKSIINLVLRWCAILLFTLKYYQIDHRPWFKGMYHRIIYKKILYIEYFLKYNNKEWNQEIFKYKIQIVFYIKDIKFIFKLNLNNITFKYKCYRKSFNQFQILYSHIHNQGKSPPFLINIIVIFKLN